MNFCSNCGVKLEKISNFCPSCGVGLLQQHQHPKSAPPKPQKKWESAPAPSRPDSARTKKKSTSIPIFMFALLGVFLSSVIALLFLYGMDFEFYSFTLWFVIPVGGLCFGMLATIFYFWRIVRVGLKPTKNHHFAALLLAVLTFVIIEYGAYQITYVTDDTNEINYQLKGSHISNYVDEHDKVLTFGNYIAYKLQNSTSTIRYRAVKIAEGIETPTNYNVIRMIINIIGFALGGLLAGPLVTQGRTHCNACKRAYVVEHKIVEATGENVNRLFDRFSHYIETDNYNELVNYIRQWQSENKELPEHNESYVFKIGVCPSCEHGYVILRNYYRKNDAEGSFEENEAKKIVVPTTNHFAANVITELKA